MNTTELIHEIARRSKSTPHPLTRRQVGYMLDTLLELMTDELRQEGGEIRLRGLGVLTVKKRAMPKTGHLVNVDLPGKEAGTYRWVQFRASSKLRDNSS
jgi:nucleoid DNA-binding protein